jgi:hypothetical protein
MNLTNEAVKRRREAKAIADLGIQQPQDTMGRLQDRFSSVVFQELVLELIPGLQIRIPPVTARTIDGFIDDVPVEIKSARSGDYQIAQARAALDRDYLVAVVSDDRAVPTRLVGARDWYVERGVLPRLQAKRPAPVI